MGSKKILQMAMLNIGDELVEGRRLNTNAKNIAAILRAGGVYTGLSISLADDKAHIAKVIAALMKDSAYHLILLTGGLGATSDDKTVQALALALKTKIKIELSYKRYLAEVFKNRRKKLEQKGLSTAEINDIEKHFLNQASIPEGFKVEKNPFGTAPFLYYKYQQKKRRAADIFPAKSSFIIALPGVPRECLGLTEKKVLPFLKKSYGKKYFQAIGKQKLMLSLKVIAAPETYVQSFVEKSQRVEHLKNPDMKGKVTPAYLPSLGELEVVFKISDAAATASLKRIVLSVYTSLSKQEDIFVYKGNKPLAKILHELLIKKGWRLGVAESCTGGQLSSIFTALPGASAYFSRGLVCYSNQAKMDFCSVRKSLLARHGAVSAEVTQAMASGFAMKENLDIVLSVSGIAGPSGGNRAKPVGTVYIACIVRGFPVEFQLLRLSGNRAQIQEASVRKSLIFMAMYLKRIKILA